MAVKGKTQPVVNKVDAKKTKTLARKAANVAKNDAQRAANLGKLGNSYQSGAKRTKVKTSTRFIGGRYDTVTLERQVSLSPSRQLRKIMRAA
jgi:hypothetical protein